MVNHEVEAEDLTPFKKFTEDGQIVFISALFG